MAPKGRAQGCASKARLERHEKIGKIRHSRVLDNPGEMAELAEGAPLLREYGVYSSIEGSNPSLSAIFSPQSFGIFATICIIPASHAPVAQLDRVPGYEPGGRAFESLRARHTSKKGLPFLVGLFYLPCRILVLYLKIG
jgi:hypothetical protein